MTKRSYKVDEFSNRAPGSDPFYESICRSMVAVLRGNFADVDTQSSRERVTRVSGVNDFP